MKTHISKSIKKRKHIFLEGLRDGIPIGLGYLAVAFSLGIAAKNAGLNALQGFFISFLNNASAGEYAGITVIAADAAYMEMFIITIVANARYLLMSCALSQKISDKTSLIHRFIIGFDVTDELFGITIARPGFVSPTYFYGAMIVALAGWSSGTVFGVLAGNILPQNIVSALSVALFGMFIAIIIPPAKQNKAVLIGVVSSFALSLCCTFAPYIKTLSSGTRTIILTIAISAVLAIIFPVKQSDSADNTN